MAPRRSWVTKPLLIYSRVRENKSDLRLLTKIRLDKPKLTENLLCIGLMQRDSGLNIYCFLFPRLEI